MEDTASSRTAPSIAESHHQSAQARNVAQRSNRDIHAFGLRACVR